MNLTFNLIALPLLRVKKHNWLYCSVFVLFYLYLLVLIRITLFPVPLPGTLGNRQTVSHILSRVNLIPFNFGRLLELHPNIIRYEIGGNILLTVPFGLSFPFLVQVRNRMVLWIALTFGLSIKTAQLLVSLAIGSAYRGVDINDVLFNAAGVLLGFLLFRACTWLIPNLKVVKD
jgi:glycopeptide antibiotics resistance protein